jgi:hypothetical protein
MPDPTPNDYARVRAEDHSRDVDAIWPEGDPVVAMAQVCLQFLCFNLALEPSHLRHSARVLTTSHVPTHNTCATRYG